MTFNEAINIVNKHPELRTQMANLFETAEAIQKIPQNQFEDFYAEFVEMAVENNPDLRN